MSILKKSYQLLDQWIDERLEKATTNAPPAAAYERRGLVEIEHGGEQQWGWKEKRSLVGPGVLKNMARKDSVIAAIIQTRVNQVSQFAQPQKDRYSAGFKIVPREPADLSKEDKLKLADPALDREEYDKIKHELDEKLLTLQEGQEKDQKKVEQFILHCGVDPDETDTTYKRCDFDQCVRLWVWDRLVYNYVAAELIPTMDRSKIHHWYPVSAGTIRYVPRKANKSYGKTLIEHLDQNKARRSKDGDSYEKNVEPYDKDADKPFRYVQVIRGRVEAAWTEDEFIYESANPSIDPEDNGYSYGELEILLQIVTAHLYAEAHNRNYFTQGIGTKGILHIKGENISRAQLEGFKRQWFNQLASTRNAFRPPIIGLADEVKWIELAQSNKDMEFDNWMHYLIKVACAVYQIDPAEINFDISKLNTSTLNESSNEQRLKNSRDKGLKPLLNYLENVVNRQVLRRWDKELAEKYEFKFVGLEAETRKEEQERLEKETQVWKTINEARIEMGKPPLEDGDVIRDANYTQYLQIKEQMKMQEQGMMEDPNAEQINEEGEGDLEAVNTGIEEDIRAVEKEIDQAATDKKKEEDDRAKAEEKKKKSEETKKSATVVEYYLEDDE